ncbi:KDM8 [Branchiostoma lanceolatum]|uniref:KDM8 protein n=1 Tax=Branchiostoma lanceolatum TaxID=7740 RepID=A0A8J9ZSW7_BRALA|nr:KDM8 [Branchiostoma lanceolatum]
MSPRYFLSIVLSILLVLLDLKAFGDESSPSSPSSEEGAGFCTRGDCPQGSAVSGEEGTSERRRGHGQPFGSHRQTAGDVAVLPYMISPEDFHQHFVSKHRPLLFKGGAKHWPAYTLWDDDYLKQHFDTEQDGNHNLVKELHPDMKKDVILPTCLRCEEMYSQSFTTRLHTGNGEAGSKLHIDTQESLFAVLRGSQTVLLVSPLHSNDVYADEATVLGVSPVDVDSVDMEKYPRVADVQYQKTALEGGDLLYVPQMWWRQVRADPGSQQALVIRWSSKPANKQTLEHNKQEQEQTPLSQELKTAGKPERKYSYGQWLAAYELWVQNVSSSSPRLTCSHQNSPMSLYSFETMKEDLEEFNGPDYWDGERCVFDSENPKCPCFYDPCLEDDATPPCVRYILDYCLDYEDRGCVIELPQLLNKLYKPDFEKLAQIKSGYVP